MRGRGEEDEGVGKGRTDRAIGVYEELGPEMMTQILITDRPVCVLRKGHALAGQRMTLKRFVGLDHVQVAPRGRSGGRMDDLLHAQGLERRVLRAVPSFQAAAALVADSDYVLTLSRRVAIILAASRELVIVEPPLKLEPYAVNLIWHPRVDADPAHRWLRGLWVAAAAEVTGDNHVGARNG